MNERLVYDRLVIGGVEIKAGFCGTGNFHQTN